MKQLVSTKKQLILDQLELLESQKLSLLNELEEINSNIDNFVYQSLDEAQDDLMDMFREKAEEDCEGSHNCGSSEYSQMFIVGGYEFKGTGSFEYNRHDKKYYFVDGQSWDYELIDLPE